MKFLEERCQHHHCDRQRLVIDTSTGKKNTTQKTFRTKIATLHMESNTIQKTLRTNIVPLDKDKGESCEKNRGINRCCNYSILSINDRSQLIKVKRLCFNSTAFDLDIKPRISRESRKFYIKKLWILEEHNCAEHFKACCKTAIQRGSWTIWSLKKAGSQNTTRFTFSFQKEP